MTLGYNTPGLPETFETYFAILGEPGRYFRSQALLFCFFFFKKLHIREFAKSEVNRNIS